ncbi:pentatricopeptide repeat-containing protein At1g14470 [Cryptomeria japonica]|uniref:pentatricopeptide repeat-containing protein At1g14470 n=1 Tax=Cryptomeria japonica TaxID=3369 RepID=UPI0027D9F16A|nr:pentatricopeptide repeat-containing protein At1g14470 [Cryptomeria japonica]
MLRALCRKGQLKEALHIMFTAYKPPEDFSTYLQLLQTCVLKNALLQGKNVHSFIAHRRFAFTTYPTFRNKLIYMYVNLGSLVDARKVFNHMEERDIDSWNSIIAAYRRHGYPHEAVSLFHQMQEMGFQPDQFTFANVLPACAKLGALKQGYAQNGFVDKALEIFKQMQFVGVKPNSTTFASILAACAKMGDLEQVATALLDMYAKCGSIDKASELFNRMPLKVATALVDMYAKCGSIGKARELFDKMPQKNVVSWTALITGYAHIGLVEKSVETFKQMQLAGVKPDSATFASVFSAFAKMGALKQGIDIHQSIKDRGILSNVIVASALVDMYAKCGSIVKARELILPACAKMGALEQGILIHRSITEGGFLSDIAVATALVYMYAKCGSIYKGTDPIHRPEIYAKLEELTWEMKAAGYSRFKTST